MATEERITIRLPRSHWQQIVDDITNMAGTSDCEILSQVDEHRSYPDTETHHYHRCENNINGTWCERWADEHEGGHVD